MIFLFTFGLVLVYILRKEKLLSADVGHARSALTTLRMLSADVGHARSALTTQGKLSADAGRARSALTTPDL